MQAKTKTAYLDFVNIIRLGAILAVILYHYIGYKLPGGFLAVDVFFILSGYFTTKSLLKKPAQFKKIDYWQTLFKRYRKLFWPLLIMLVFTIFYITLFAGKFRFNLIPTVASSLTFTNNWYQILGNFSYFDDFLNPSAFTHLWYIALQMQFYILWPIILTGFRKISNRKSFLNVMVGILMVVSFALMYFLYQPGLDPSRVYYGTDTRLYTLMIGALIAINFEVTKVDQALNLIKIKLNPKIVVWGLYLVSLIAIVAMFLLVQDNSWFTYRIGFLLFDTCFALHFMTSMYLFTGRNIPKIFNPLLSLGQVSSFTYYWYYPIYMIFYKTAAESNFFTKNMYLQILLIIFLAYLTRYFIKKLPAVWRLLSKIPKFNFKEINNTKRNYADFFAKLSLSQIAFLTLSLIVMTTFMVGTLASPMAKNVTLTQVAEAQKADEEAKKKALAEQRQKELSEVTAFGRLSKEETLFANNLSATFIGDSTLLAIKEPLQAVYENAYIDGAVGRQFSQSLPVVQSIVNEGLMRDTVIIMLGTNGGMGISNVTDIIDLLGSREIYFVNVNVPRVWQEEVNQNLTIATKDRKNVHLIDWYTISQGKSEWFSEDGVHPREQGANELIILITESIYKVQANK